MDKKSKIVNRKTKELQHLLQGLIRPKRDCSISMYILMLELADGEELSSLSIDRRLKKMGMQNPRQLLHAAVSQGWLQMSVSVDGKYWRLTAAGQAVVAGLERRLDLARELM